MAKLELTRGYWAEIDDDKLEWASQWKWSAKVDDNNKHVYAVRGTVTRTADGKKKSKMYRLHRELMQVGSGKTVDHINGNTLDNRMCNLRIVTISQNGKNMKKHKDGKSNYKCVYYITSKRKFRVEIMANGKKLHIGYFTDELSAAKAYNLASKLLHGEFGCLNETDEQPLDSGTITSITLKVESFTNSGRSR